MNTEHFKTQLAGTVATKAGISSKQAKQIVHCVIGLPSRTTKKRLNLFGLGEVIVIKRQATAEFDPTFTCAVKIPYKEGAKFKMAKKFKTLMFRDLENAKRKPSKYYEKTGFEKIVTFSGLEGDPDVPVRRKKGLETIKAEPEGDPDTKVRRPGQA